jgi:hypothetical protein
VSSKLTPSTHIIVWSACSFSKSRANDPHPHVYIVEPSTSLIHPAHRVHNARRDVRRAARTRVRTRDLDQIQGQDLKPERRAQLENQEIDESKPGLGQHVSMREHAVGWKTDDGGTVSKGRVTPYPWARDAMIPHSSTHTVFVSEIRAGRPIYPVFAHALFSRCHTTWWIALKSKFDEDEAKSSPLTSG